MAKTRVEPGGRADDELAVLSTPGMQEVAGLALAGGAAMQQMRTAYATAIAVQKPRQLPEVRRRLLEEAQLCGEDFFYGWGVGNDALEGASVKLAMAAARCWGNCVVNMEPVQELGDSWVFTAAFVDLETGFTLTRQFRQSKSYVVHGKHDQERKADIRFQIGQSKAARNVVLNALPSGLIDQAVAEAKEGVRKTIEKYIAEKGQPAAASRIIRALAKIGVDEKRVLAKCNVAEAKGLTLEDLVLLNGDLKAIENGQERPETLFPVSKTEEALDKLKEKNGNGAVGGAGSVAGKGSPPGEPGKAEVPPEKSAEKPAEKPADKAGKTAEVLHATAEQNQQIDALAQDLDMKPAEFNKKCKELGADPARPTRDQAAQLIAWMLSLANKGDEQS